ncbi:MAG: CBS domain-containing protein [Planctomycetes bacterium]|nr:CBS domain-containing protein [Planctomycetota bacterium]
MARPKGIPLRAFAIYLFAAIVGVAGGLLGSAFLGGLRWLQDALVGPGPDPAHPERLSEAVRANFVWWQTLLLPAAGGLAAGLFLLLLRGQRPPFGIADLVALVQLRKRTIRLRESLVQIASSICTIGSGGSIGREGANSQIAATVASLLARWTALASRPRAVLVGCGIAAGMATSYNAPITGAIFVMEVVLGNFAMDVFAPIVLAAVLATMLRNRLLSEQAIYVDAAAQIEKLPWTLDLSAVLLGLLCGAGAILFRHSLAGSRRLFARLRLPPPVAMALGGLAVGAIGLFPPEAWGNGFEVIQTVAGGTPGLAVLLTLFLWKLLATCATVGSGGLGGIFTPNLVTGAALGGLFAFGLDLVGDVSPGERMAFAFVGMAGLCAGTMHAPVTAVVLVFELTGHYELTLPVMLCSIVASITANLLDEDSYYTAAIRAQGEALPRGIEELAIRSTYVRDVLRPDCLVVRDTAGFEEVMALLRDHRGDTVYVQDRGGLLVGRIELQDVKCFLNDPTLSSVVIAADLTRPAVTARPDDSIAALLRHFDDPELREIAVVPAAGPARLLGRVRHWDVIRTLGSEVLGPQRRTTRVRLDGDRPDLVLPAGHELATLPVPDSWQGLAVEALSPEMLGGAIVVLALPPAGDPPEPVAATPDLVLPAGGRIVVLGPRAAIERLRRDAAPGEP